MSVTVRKKERKMLGISLRDRKNESFRDIAKLRDWVHKEVKHTKLLFLLFIGLLANKAS